MNTKKSPYSTFLSAILLAIVLILKITAEKTLFPKAEGTPSLIPLLLLEKPIEKENRPQRSVHGNSKIRFRYFFAECLENGMCEVPLQTQQRN